MSNRAQYQIAEVKTREHSVALVSDSADTQAYLELLCLNMSQNFFP